MEKKDLKEMTIDEMKTESLECAFEIAKLRSIIEKHQKRFNELSYNIWLKLKDETNTETNK